MEILQQRIADLFTSKKSIAETAFASLYEALSLESNQRELFVIGKHSVVQGSEIDAVFKSRLDKLPQILQVDWSWVGAGNIKCGVDSQGFPFVIVPWVQSSRINVEESLGVDGLGLFIQIAQAVQSFHAQGLPYGDLSLLSFRTIDTSEDTDGIKADVFGFSPFGLGSSKGRPSISMPSMKNMSHVFAPELRIGEDPSLKSDIFSLGVLGYELLCGKEHIQNDAGGGFLRNHPEPSELNDRIPPWIDTLLGHCLQLKPDRRIPTVIEILKYVEEGIRKDSVSLPEVAWSSRELVIQRGGSVSKIQDSAKEIQPKGKLKSHDMPHSRRKRKARNAKKIILGIWFLTAMLVIGISVALLQSYHVIQIGRSKLPSVLAAELTTLEKEGLYADAVRLTTKSEHLEVRKTSLKTFLKKDISLDKGIVQVFQKRNYLYSEDFDQYIQSAIVHWSGELGYVKFTSEIKDLLFKIGQSEHRLSVYQNLLFLIDPSESEVVRQGALRSLFVVDSDQVFRLTALLVEESSSASFTPLFREFLSRQGYYNLPEELKGSSLFVLSPACRSLIDAANLEDFLASIPRSELKFIATAALTNTLKRDSELLVASLNEYLKGLNLGSQSDVIVRAARRESIKGSAESISLYRLVLGTANAADVNMLSEWSSSDWEAVCYSVLMVSEEPNVLNATMDVLHRRKPSDDFVVALLDWMRNSVWQNRAKYSRALANFALRDEKESSKVSEAFDILMPVSHGGLFPVLMKAPDVEIRKEAIVRIGTIVPPLELLPYLKDPSPEVRLATVRALANKNDIHTLQGIVRAFDSEKDKSVIAAYHKHHWVTLRRSNDGLSKVPSKK